MSTPRKLRIAIANDSMLEAEALRRTIASVPEYEIAWIARDGGAAVSQCARDTPDLVLMNLIMPILNGVQATQQIMQTNPCAILLITADVNEHANKVFEAMGHGALDAIDTPSIGLEENSLGRNKLLQKIATLSKLVIRADLRRSSPKPPLLAIGASTGGPKALAMILSQLPASFPAAIVIVQHVDAQFASGLVNWLDTQTPLTVKLAITGEKVEGNCVMIAGTNDHLIITPQLTFQYTEEPMETPFRPSVDIFFHSIMKNWKSKGVGLLLTGMGKDGAEGLAALKSAGWHTIAQDEATSIVYGMPKAAFELGAACEILPIEAIASACNRQISLLRA
ncbi:MULTISPECIES: chemotaxis response regulator protein-glutamate methylesterase [Pseudanabaena]|uniref:Protein-glutamate methylesterase/protein-glutamine glutaminase n=2 Tax=Pseudanabaena TaxID=1152 RepID=L8N398_9CYAN|nr:MULTISPECIES: chemotaxis response regulator protein-glutamate methylesterase [Pseudanabaena]ELS32723.1 response regulator receiver modulated CheB methylesterase [Pseudanabaena biceps PCC 7429]MDG3495044.1 chemotaxis response regulator protein-glutamate methylesterase [Pseudanabaena catenata USMAC16]